MRMDGTDGTVRPASLSGADREILRQIRKGQPPSSAELLERMERLADERDALERLRTEHLEPVLTRLSYEGGALNVWFSHPIIQFFVLQLTGMFAAEKATNYLETMLTLNGTGFVITIRRWPTGKTPAQLAAEAQEEAKLLRGLLENTIEDGPHSFPQPGDAA
jgi:hypothetical protein